MMMAVDNNSDEDDNNDEEHVDSNSDGDTRELKQRWRRQRERNKIIGLMSKTNRSARVLYVSIHFFAVISKTTT